MQPHRARFEHVRKSTGMYLLQETFAAAAAFVVGYDHACEGGVLVGFREWLVLRLRTGTNLSWPPLVLLAAFPDAKSPEDAVGASARTERRAIDTLFDLLAEFDDVRSQRDGLRKIFSEYAAREKEFY